MAIILSFSLVSAVSAQSGYPGGGGYPGSGWQIFHCDALGHNIPADATNTTGQYKLQGTQTATNSTTIAQDIFGASYPMGNYTNSIKPAFEGDNRGDIDYGIGFDGYFEQMAARNCVYNSSAQWVGTLPFTNSAGQPAAPPPGSLPPNYMNLLLKTQLYAYVGMSPGTYAEAWASDGPPFMEKIGANGIINGFHLVRATTDANSVGETYLNGAVHMLVKNPVAFNPNGEAQATAYAFVSASASVATAVPLNATFINRDNPANTAYQTLPSPVILYGGSIASTSDILSLNASSPITGTTYTWSASGPGSYTPPAANIPIWNVALQAVPGTQTFECDVQAPGTSPIVETFTVEVGIRTDDTIMVGWIDANGVTVPSGAAALAASVHAPVLHDFAPGLGAGLPGSDPAFPFNPGWASAAIVALAENDDCINYPSPHPVLPYLLPDKDYILNWMFKYSANPDLPTTLLNLHSVDVTNPNLPLPSWYNLNPYIPVNTSSDFTCFAGYMDYVKYQSFLSDPHRFKLVNHFQVKYRVNPANPAQFNGAPIVLQHDALVGQTVNPTNIPPDFIQNTLNWLAELPAPYNWGFLAPSWTTNFFLNPQYGPANGLVGPTGDLTHISQCNDGSPDIFATRAFNTLMAMDVPNPLFWQNIGSKITFKCGSTSPVYQLPENYPTYYLYQNGIKTLSFVQATSPKGHFFASPYPFGTDPSYGLLPQWPGGTPVLPAIPGLPSPPSFPTLPGGRNGIATLPGDASSPTPPYTVP